MQLPKANKDLLIFPPSISLIPFLPDILARSLPAKSIRFNFPNLILLILLLLLILLILIVFILFTFSLLFSFSL